VSLRIIIRTLPDVLPEVCVEVKLCQHRLSLRSLAPGSAETGLLRTTARMKHSAHGKWMGSLALHPFEDTHEELKSR